MRDIGVTGVQTCALPISDRIVAGGLEQGRRELNETRRRAGLPPLDHVHGGDSRQLAIRPTVQIRRAAWWGRVEISGVPASFKKKTHTTRVACETARCVDT